jgi:hypothetical protein
MPQTVKDILKASGFSEEQIAAIDAKQMAAFGNVMTAAETERNTASADFNAAKEAVARAEKERTEAIAAREAAELAQRSNVDFYESKIVPGLTGWDEEKTRLENERVQALAQAAFYKAQNEGAKSGGFIPADAPGYVAPVADPNRDGNGRYVAGGGGTPGSPVFDASAAIKRAGDGMAMLSNIEWRYRKLYNDVMPIPPSQLIAEAEAQKLDPVAYAEKRFNFSQREQELNAQQRTTYEAKLKADERAAADAEWDAKMKAREAEFAAKEKQRAEQGGNNPDVRMPAGSSKFTEIKRAEQAGTLKSPTKMTDAERKAQTRNMIHSEMEARETVGA